METLLRGLLSGFIVGIVCVVYVLFRSWRVESQIHGSLEEDDSQEDIIGSNWLLMAFLASASVVWGFIGAGIYRFLGSQFHFIFLSLLLALFISITLYIKNVSYKLDKIVLTLIITIGLGFLIPYVI